MSVSLPNGALVAIAASYGVPSAMTALTNANPAVASLAVGHGIVAGDVFEITSGWSRLTNKVARASIVATNDVTVENVNALSVGIYPAGGGVGSVRKILSWTQLSQVLTSASSGGAQNFLDYQFLESDAAKQIPTFKSAAGLTLSVADDPTLPGYQLVSDANDDRLPRAVRITLPSGAKIFYNAYISIDKTPSLNINQLMAVAVTLSLTAEPIRYVN